jgi:hypothetical protein
MVDPGDPFGGGDADPFGGTAATSWPAPPPPAAPSLLPPSPEPTRPRNNPQDKVVLAGWLFAGVGAVVLTLAAGIALAQTEFEWYYGDNGWLAASLAAAATLLGAAFIWSAVLIVQGRRFARPLAAVGCGLTLGLATLGLVVAPGDAVAWFAHLTQVCAVAATMLALAAAVLLFLPSSGARVPETPPKPMENKGFADVMDRRQDPPPVSPAPNPVDFDPFS